MAGTRSNRAEYLAGGGAIAAAIVLAVTEVWPFARARAAGADASIWEALVYDGAVLGFLKLGLVMVALYGIASVPALIAGGRWAKGMGTSGIVADESAAESHLALVVAERAIEQLQARLAQVEEEYADLAATVDDDGPRE